MTFLRFIWEIQNWNVFNENSVVVFGLFDSIYIVVKFVLHSSVDQEEWNRQNNDDKVQDIKCKN